MKSNARGKRQLVQQKGTRPPRLKKPTNERTDKRGREMAAEIFRHQRLLRHSIANSVRETLDARIIGFGLEEGKELQEDLRHLRFLRKRAEQVHGFLLKGIITCALTCFIGAAWIGLKTAIGH